MERSVTEKKESKTFIYVYSAMEKRGIINKTLSKEEREEVERIRQDYLLQSKNNPS